MSGQGTDYNVDIVMCIDGTASMAPIIEEVKANALSFADKFHEAMENEDKSVDQLRVKVIVFRDFECDADAMVQSDFFVLPEQNEQLKEFVNDIHATGGGDLPENALEALALALKSDWTTGGSKRRHAVLIFSDAAALELGARAGKPGYPEGMPADLAELGAWWEGTTQTMSSTFQPKYGRLVAFVPNAYPWTEIQAWNRYWPAFSQAGTGLTDVDMGSVIDLLVGSFGNK